MSSSFNWDSKTKVKRLHHKGLLLQWVYSIDRPLYKFLLAIGLGIFMAIITLFLVSNSGLVSGGMTSITQSIARLTKTLMSKSHASAGATEAVYLVLFWGLFAFLNIPLIIFSYYRIGKLFAKLSVVYAVTMALVGFSLSYIPHISDFLIFGNTIPLGTATDHTLSNNIFVQHDVYCLPFSFATSDRTIFDVNADPVRALFLFIYGLVYGFLSALFFGCLYALGGCKLGLDCISFYYAKTKNKNVAGITGLANNIATIFSIILGNWIPAILVSPRALSWQFFFSANLVVSIISMLLYSFVLNIFYPVNQIAKVEIFSRSSSVILRFLHDANYTHLITQRDSSTLITYCPILEVDDLIHLVRGVDHHAAISVFNLSMFSGKIRNLEIGDKFDSPSPPHH